MGIYLRNIEMPKSCYDCPLCYDMMECSASDIRFFKVKEKSFDFCTERHPNCPLVPVPAHGRLIEAEPIMKYITDRLNSGEFGYDQIEVLTEIQYAPTIIQADHEEEEMK